ncbi:MAG: hypothetical protein ABMA13_21340 [Chthoniobacteraceae bacterium]
MLQWLLISALTLVAAHAQTSRPARPTSNAGSPNIGFFLVESNVGPGTVIVNFFPAAAVQRGAQGVIAGQPVMSGVARSLDAGNYRLTFAAIDGYFTPKPLVLTVSPGARIELNFVYRLKPTPHILSTALPRGVVGTAYDATIAVSGNPTTIAFNDLPAGLQDLGGGRVAGTPQAAGTATVGVTAQNADGEDTAMLPLQVSDPGAIGAGRLEITYDTAAGVVEPLAAAVHHVPQGESLTLSARPLPGFVFAGWQVTGTSSFTERDLAFTFFMPADLRVEARFIPSPYRALAGSYEGTLNSGAIRSRLQLRLLSTGLFTAKFQSSGASRSGVAFLGHFGNAGLSKTTTRSVLDRDPAAPATFNYQLSSVLDFDLHQIAIELYVVTPGSPVGQSHFGNALPRASAVAARPFAGRYTAAIVVPSPGAHGCGSLVVSKTGAVRFTGRWTLGESIAAAGGLNTIGEWPFFAETSTTPLAGSVYFTTPEPGYDATGSLNQPPLTTLPFRASRFTPVPLIDYAIATGALGGGALTAPLNLALTLSPRGVITDPANGFAARVDPRTGFLTRAGFPNPAGGAPAIVRGVILQKSRQAFGQHSLRDADGLPGVVEWQAAP